MKRIRIAAGLMLSAALLTISFGAQAGSSAEPGPVALLATTVCEDLVEDFETYGIQVYGGDAVINLEMVGPVHPLDPTSAWLPLEPPQVSLFRCDRPAPGAISSDIAAAT